MTDEIKPQDWPDPPNPPGPIKTHPEPVNADRPLVPEGFQLVQVAKVELLKRISDGALYELDGVTPYEIKVIYPENE